MTTTQKENLYKQIAEELKNNEEFLKAFAAAENENAMLKLLTEKGYEVSLDDVREMYEEGEKEILKHKEDANNDELSEQSLESVAGGGWLRGLLRTAVSVAVGFGYGCICGVVPGAYAGARYVAGGLAYWSARGYNKKGW